MLFTQKETTLLKDTQKQEQLCVQKYVKASAKAKDPQLKALFEEIGAQESEHVRIVTQMLRGEVTDYKASNLSNEFTNYYDEVSDPTEKQEDSYLCEDCLDIEKHVSNVYNTSIFEFQDSHVRSQLNELQTEEQQHGEVISSYMKANGMC